MDIGDHWQYQISLVCSPLLQEMRCPNMVHPNPNKGQDKKCKLCMFCMNKRGIFHPIQPAWSSCALCGNYVPKGHVNSGRSVDFCMQHQRNKMAGMEKCYTCDRVLPPSGGPPGQDNTVMICTWCSTGLNRCCHLQTESSRR